MRTQVDAFSPKFQRVFSFTLERDDEHKVTRLIDIQVHNPKQKVQIRPTDLLGETFELVDFNNKKLYTFEFSDSVAAFNKPRVFIEKIREDRTLEVTDIETGLLFHVYLDSHDRVRYAGFPSEKNEDNPNLPMKMVKGDDGEVKEQIDENFFINRHIVGFDQTGERKVTVRYSSTGLRHFPKVTVTDGKKNTIRDLVRSDVVEGAHHNEDISAELELLIQKTRELPGVGKRMDIIDSFLSKIRKKKADEILFGKTDNDEKHPLLGSTVRDFGHMAFLGNPGTLKTVFVEIIYLALKAEGYITGPLVRVNGREVVQGYIGQSEVAMREKIEEAVSKNGMLFVDEFHALDDTGMGGKGKEFGAQAVRELIPVMENQRDNFLLIIAGYPKAMRDAIKNIDEGLKDRLSETFLLEDYTPDELEDIFYYLVPDRFVIDEDAKDHIRMMIEDVYDNRDETFGNGRAMRNLVNAVVKQQNLRLYKEGFYDRVIAAKNESGELSTFAREKLQGQANYISYDDVKDISLDVLSEIEDENDEKGPLGFGDSAARERERNLRERRERRQEREKQVPEQQAEKPPREKKVVSAANSDGNTSRFSEAASKSLRPLKLDPVG